MDMSSSVHLGLALHSAHLMYWAIIGQSIKEWAAVQGVRLSVASYTLGDTAAAADSLLHDERVDVLIATTSPNDDDMVPHARRAGVPVVRVGGTSAQVRCAIYGEERLLAAQVAEYLLGQIDHRGEVVEICGTDAALDRSASFRAVAERHSGVQVVARLNAQWDRAEAYAAMLGVLKTHPHLRAAFCHNDDLALGAMAALAEAGRQGSVVLAGFDGVPDGLRAIRAGDLAATAYRPLRTIGQRAAEAAVAVAQGRAVAEEVPVAGQLITADNVADAMLDTMAILPGLLTDMVQGAAAQKQLQQEIIASQQALIQQLSTPIIPITERVLIVPLVGTVDGARAQRIIDTLLEAIARFQAEIVLLDITGVNLVDTHTAQYLLRTAQAAQLLGTQLLLVGITPEVAQTMVHLGVDLSSIKTYSTLQAGFAMAMQRRRT